MPNRNPPNSLLVQEVLSYFLHHPAASDTLTGVASWRLMKEQIQQSVEGTRDAIAWLVAAGYLRGEDRPGVGELFQLNADRKLAAQTFLQQASDAEKGRE